MSEEKRQGGEFRPSLLQQNKTSHQPSGSHPIAGGWWRAMKIHVKELGKSEYIIVRKWQLVWAGAAAGVRVRSGWVYCANVSCHHIEVHNKMAPLYNGWLMTRARAESLICPAWPGLNTHQATEIRALGVSSWLWSSPRDWSVNTNMLSQDIKDPLSTSQSHTFKRKVPWQLSKSR